MFSVVWFEMVWKWDNKKKDNFAQKKKAREKRNNNNNKSTDSAPVQVRRMQEKEKETNGLVEKEKEKQQYCDDRPNDRIDSTLTERKENRNFAKKNNGLGRQANVEQ